LNQLKEQVMKIVILCVIFVGFNSYALPKIAVVDFDATKIRDGGNIISEQLSEYVVDELVNSGLFEVVEREKLHDIMREQGFSNSGMVEMSTAAQMGRLLGAKFLLTGKIISLNRQVKNFSGYGVNTKNAVYTISASIRIFNVESGSIEFSTKENSSYTINAGGGLSVEIDNVYQPLAEELGATLVTKLTSNPKFTNKSLKTNEPKNVKVIFYSVPEYADVEIDGVFYGNTGSEIEVTAGQHSVKISLSGYDDWEKKVMVKEGLNLTARLAESRH